MESKVIEIKDENREYNGVHLFSVKFEDSSDVFSYWSKAKSTPFKEGDLVDHEREINGDKKKMKLNRKKGGFPPAAAKSSTGMMVGAAINNTIQLVVAGKIDIKDIEKVAGRICEIAVKLEEKYKK
jgi:hypothetical protein